MMKIRLKNISIIAAVFAAFVLCGCNAADTGTSLRESESLAMVCTPELLQELDTWESLRFLDAEGSDCYDELSQFSRSHPQVDVRFSVELDGLRISNKDTYLDYTGHDAAALETAAAWLGDLRQIELGETELTSQELSAIRESFPTAELSYSFAACGQHFKSTDERADFSLCTEEEFDEISETAAKLPQLREVILPETLPFPDYASLYERFPEIDYNYSFELFGLAADTHTEELRYKKVEIGDENVVRFYDYLPYLPSLRYISFDRCGTGDDTMSKLRDDFPDIKVVWRVWFDGFTVMSDAEKIWAIGGLNDSETEALKYCTDVKYLDLGHNDISKIDFVEYMPKLEVAIFSLTKLDDLSPIVHCQQLEYLEVADTRLKDISPAGKIPNLQHLNFAQNPGIKDISSLYDMPNLQRLYFSECYSVPEEQVEHMRQLHPECDVNNDPFNAPWSGEWRYAHSASGHCTGYSERYILLREQIGYDKPFSDARLYEYEYNGKLYEP